jgi:hypothetical protein
MRSGWVSLTATETEDSKQESNVQYMAPVFALIIDNATVQHLLYLSQEATKHVAQQFTIVTFYLTAAKEEDEETRAMFSNLPAHQMLTF